MPWEMDMVPVPPTPASGASAPAATEPVDSTELPWLQTPAAPVGEVPPIASDPFAEVQGGPLESTRRAEAQQPLAPSTRSAGPSPASAEFGAVAERLERLARQLREAPDQLLAGPAADSLDVLLVGYALGFRHGTARLS